MMTAARARRVRRGPAEALILLMVLAWASAGSAQSEIAAPKRPKLEVPEGIRLLVIAPHPDDETLGAGGLMQRVRRLHGRVSVAYLTNGDGFVDGVELETKTLKPKPEDFVDYGEQRLNEALRALQAISVSPKRLLFFGFPDGGLINLLTTHWSSTNPYVSPYTGDDRPPYPQSVSRAGYSGVALERELARVITQVNPRWIVVTGPWDVHPDHCAAFHFVVRALRRLAASNVEFKKLVVLAYTVHRRDWPVSAEGGSLPAPPNVVPEGGEWRFLELTASELDGKGRALDEYVSQMDIMAVLFRGFVRPNEVFALYPSVPAEPTDACGQPMPPSTSAHFPPEPR